MARGSTDSLEPLDDDEMKVREPQKSQNVPVDEVARLLHTAIEVHNRELQGAHADLARARAELDILAGQRAQVQRPETSRQLVPYSCYNEQSCVISRTSTYEIASEPSRQLHVAVQNEGSLPAAVQVDALRKSTDLCRVARGSSKNSSTTSEVAAPKASFQFKSAWNRKPPPSAGYSEDTFVMRNMDFIQKRKGRRPSRLSSVIGYEKTWGIIRPDSTERLAWDVSGLCLIFYDFITIPLVFCFGIVTESEAFLHGMDWLTLVFWTGDMCQGFFLAYFEEGRLVTSHFKILKHYVTGWFFIDILVVAPGWFTKFDSVGTGGQEVGFLAKVFKSARAIRILRLVRLVKLQRIMNSFYDRIEDERKFIMVNLVKLLLAVSVLNHLIACLWYLIGYHTKLAGMRNWVGTYLVEGEHSLLDMYLVSLHWSMTQFTPASMAVSATNEIERAFSICVLFFAMVCFSSIVASISGSMTQLRSMNSDTQRQFWLLRRYLRQSDVDADLGSRVCKFLEYQLLGKPRKVDLHQLPCLRMLSEELHNELVYFQFWGIIRQHPCFQLLRQDAEVQSHRLCSVCLSAQVWAQHEVIFGTGDEGVLAYFFKEAEGMPDDKEVHMEYRFGFDDQPELVWEPGTCISEAALWTCWRHLGELRCNSICELITVEPGKFSDCLIHHPRSWFLARVYGQLLLGWLSSLEPCEVSDLLYDGDLHDYMQATFKSGTIDFISDGNLAEFLKTFEGIDWYKASSISMSRSKRLRKSVISTSADLSSGRGGIAPSPSIDDGSSSLPVR